MRRLKNCLKLLNGGPKPVYGWQPSGNTEHPIDYHMSGMCPIKLHEVLNGRYQILRKLGHGRYATIWLAKDQILSKYAALKIPIPIHITPDPELSALSKLNEGNTKIVHTTVPVPRLLNSFHLERSCSKHMVLVLEPLGSTLRQLIDDIRDRDMYGVGVRSLNILRGMARQMVEAVGFVHAREMVHRDIHLGNFLLRLRQSPDTAAQHLVRHPAIILEPHCFGLDHFGVYGPSYIVEPESLEHVLSTETLPSDLELVLSDFGAATNLGNANDGHYTYPLDVRSPEQILGIPISEKADIWALGCAIFHLVTMRHMFNIDGFASVAEQDDEHLQGMIEALGARLPDSMLRRWTRRASHFSEDGSLLTIRLRDPLNRPLTEQISEDKPEGMSDLEATQFGMFIRFILCTDPQKRPAAEEILRHPWLA